LVKVRVKKRATGIKATPRPLRLADAHGAAQRFDIVRLTVPLEWKPCAPVA
jgi:hypothetical protein